MTYEGAGSSHSRGRSVQQTTDGGYIVVGDMDLFSGTAVYLIKTNDNGDTVWTRTYGGTYEGRRYSYGNSIQQTTDGGYIITGQSSYDALDYDVYLFKTNSSGDTLWTKTYESGYGHSVQQTTDGGYIITGETWSFGDSLQIYLIKTDVDGNVGVEGIKPEGDIPTAFDLWQNYPNPFNPTTTIRFSLPKEVHVSLRIYNTLGQEVVQLLSQDLSAGTYTTEWNPLGIVSGVYYYRLEAGGFVETKKLILLR